jgi:undecaprenyl pyrophosphate phosphatase UppP
MIDAGIGIEVLSGIASATVFGYLAIDRLLSFLRTHDLKPFVIYRIVLAAIVVGLVLARRA